MEDQNRTFCKLCLVTNVKMYSLNTPSILEAYSQLLQVVICEDSQMYVCYECTSLLRKYQEFRLKCMTALNVLTSLNVDHSKITKKLVQNIDRNIFNLVSKLVCCSIIVCSSNDQYLIPNDCLNSEIKKKIEVDSDCGIELEMPEITIEMNTCGPNNDHITLSGNYINEPNEIKDKDLIENTIQSKRELNDNELNNSACVPQLKIKPKCLLKPKKNKENAKKSNTACYNRIQIKHEYNNSNLNLEPLAKKTVVKENSNIYNKPLAKKSKKSKVKENKLIRREKCAEDSKNRFKDYATVEFMTPEDNKREMLLRKESRNYRLNAHKCDLCYKGFISQTTYDNHMKKHSPEFGSFECEYCHQRFHRKTLLNYHKVNFHQRKYMCKICPYVCYSRVQANSHMNRHKGKKFECQECGQCFRMSNSLSSHKRLKHSTEVICTLCGSSYGSAQGLNCHQKISHKQDSTELLGPKCEECDVQFATETAWKRHLVLSSKHTVSNGCVECGETFSTKEGLRIHGKTHPQKRPYDNIYIGFIPPAACEICDKWLSTRLAYREHMKSEHPSSDVAKRIKQKEALELVCEVCGMVYKKRWLLLEHQLKHTGEYPFECSDCGKKFRKRSTLSQHKHTHAPTRVFECDLCQRQYRTKPALARHIKKGHFGIRPHECSYCHKRFQFNCEVRMHIEYVHQSKPWPKRDRTTRSAKGEKSVLK